MAHTFRLRRFERELNWIKYMNRITTLTPVCTARVHPDLQQTVELAWTAGFIDGEGCIYLSRYKNARRAHPTYRLVVTVAQNHLGSLKRVAQALAVPERIYTIKRSLRMNRDGYVLNISDQDADRSLRTLLPYLGRKGPEAQVAIEAYQNGQLSVHPGPNGHSPGIWKIREAAYSKLQRMK